MKLIAFTRPDGKLLWINPEQVCFATVSSDYAALECVEVSTPGGKVVVRGRDAEVAAKLGDHMSPDEDV